MNGVSRHPATARHGGASLDALSARSRRVPRSSLAAASALLIAGLASPVPADPPPYEGRSWRLVFGDEFDGTAVDTTRWNFHYPWGRTHNHEAYSRTQNVSVSGGRLILTAREESYGGKPFTTGVVTTSGKFHATYGYLEARLKMPSSVGSWPAFWTLQSGWPPEIDIMEFPLSDTSHDHNEKYRYWWNFHWGTVSDHRSAGAEIWQGADLTQGFHDYAVEWWPDSLRFFFDDKVRGTVSDREAIAQCAEHYLILNYAVGGWPGYPPSWPSQGDTYEIDWVRVWQIEEPPEPIDLGNIVGGGDGSPAVQSPHAGIHPGTGEFGDDLELNGVRPSGASLKPVPGALVDSVFLITDDRCATNTLGTLYGFPHGDSAPGSWDLISNGIEADAPPGLLRLGPKGPFLRGVGIHAASGVTFDLDGIRAQHGSGRVAFFSAFVGEGSLQAGGSVNGHVLLADAEGRLLHSRSTGPHTDDARFVEVEIPRRARFLTLASGSAGDGNGQDHGVFANASITPCGASDPTLCPPGFDEALIFSGSAWRYLDEGPAPPVGWEAPQYSAPGWKSGTAQFGYGDGDESTVIEYGGAPDRKRIATHFRKAFQVEDSGGVSALSVWLLKDDGALVYLNGTEVLRANLPEGPIGFSTLASLAIDGAAERNWVVSSVDPCLLVDGTNVVAVEVHQGSVSSSDLSFDLVLAAERAPGGRPPCGERFSRGDANGDGGLDIGDPVFTLASLFLGGAGPSCLDSADSNDDGTLDIGDPIRTLQFLFLAGAAPPEPWPGCGGDPTDDELDCADYPACP